MLRSFLVLFMCLPFLGCYSAVDSVAVEKSEGRIVEASHCISIVGFASEEEGVIAGAVNRWAQEGAAVYVGDQCKERIERTDDPAILGHTGGYVGEALVQINPSRYEIQYNPQMMLYEITLHELGHLLGARNDHLPWGNIMASSLSLDTPQDLTAADIAYGTGRAL
jgi:hypothetical protein